MTDKIRLAIVIPAAGVGSRMASNTPKQYLSLNQKTIIQHTIDTLSALDEVSFYVSAISDGDPYFKQLSFNTPVTTVTGGKERADSVLNALTYLSENQRCDWVLVHDAARPLVDLDDVKTLINQCLRSQQGGILASRVKDTIKRGSSHIDTTVPRADLWQAYTPQMFKLTELHHALSFCLENNVVVTDEASAMEHLGHPVQLIESRSDNIKVTTPEDLLLAELLLSKREKQDD